MKFMASVLFLAAFCFLAATPVWANEIVNGGFETGDFTGWTQSGNTTFTDVTNALSSPPYVYDGNFGARLGPFGSDGYLTQVFNGNTFSFQFREDPSWWGLDDVDVELSSYLGGGQELYFVSFWLYSNGLTPNGFTLLWNGTDVGPSLVNAGPFLYKNYSEYLVGYAPASVLASVLEPTSLLLLGTGLAGVGLAMWRKRK